MKPTIPYIEDKFKGFNELMFGGRLPLPKILLSDAASYLGICKSKIRHTPDGRMEHYDFQLRFNVTYDLPENVVEDTIIHEMIHYFIMLHGLRDTSPHGQIFKSIMKSINTNFGRNLSISHRVTNAQKAQAKSSKPTWHVIAVITFRSGETGIKVLPRVIPKIIDFHNRISAVREVREITLHLHDNPYFNQYPTSTALRYHELDSATISRELQGARKLIVRGSELIQR